MWEKIWLDDIRKNMNKGGLNIKNIKRIFWVGWVVYYKNQHEILVNSTF